MGSARSKAEDRVARDDGAAIDDVLLLHYADAKPGEVVFAIGIHARHLGGLAADQRAAGELAAFGDALDYASRDLVVELAAGEVVEEEKRLRALHQHVVHAHRYKIDADSA